MQNSQIFISGILLIPSAQRWSKITMVIIIPAIHYCATWYNERSLFKEQRNEIKSLEPTWELELYRWHLYTFEQCWRIWKDWGTTCKLIKRTPAKNKCHKIFFQMIVKFPRKILIIRVFFFEIGYFEMNHPNTDLRLAIYFQFFSFLFTSLWVSPWFKIGCYWCYLARIAST